MNSVGLDWAKAATHKAQIKVQSENVLIMGTSLTRETSLMRFWPLFNPNISVRLMKNGRGQACDIVILVRFRKKCVTLSYVKTSTLTIRLDPITERLLKSVAKRSGRTRSDIA